MKKAIAFSVLTLTVLLVVGGAMVWAQGQATSKPASSGPAAASGDNYWVEPMKKVHEKFKGEKGIFQVFGDSITCSLAFWSPSAAGMDEKAKAAFDTVNTYMYKDCWTKRRDPSWGCQGRMTIAWAQQNIDAWLKKANPEVALIMFGTNDVGGVKPADHEKMYREVIQKCLDNGTILILSTIPPRSGADARVKELVEVQRKLAKEFSIPLCDYYEAIVSRRPTDWDGTKLMTPENKDVFNVNAPISGDGVHPSNPAKYRDYSAESLKNNGFLLRTYVSLLSYADVIDKVLKPEKK